MLFIKSTNSNALAVAFFFARFRRAPVRSDTTLKPTTTACSAPITETTITTVTVTATTASSASSIAPLPTTVAPVANSTVASITTSTGSVTTLVGSSTSSGVLPAGSVAPPAPPPGSGSVNISSRCTFPVWYLLWDDNAKDENWTALPPGGASFSFADYGKFNGTDLSVSFGFSNTSDSAGSLNGSQLSFTWLSGSSAVTYSIKENIYYGASPFVPNGQLAWPMPLSNPSFPYCDSIHCLAGQNPCAAAYQYDEVPQATSDQLYGNKTSLCPDSITLNYQLCTDVYT